MSGQIILFPIDEPALPRMHPVMRAITWCAIAASAVLFWAAVVNFVVML